MKRPSAHALLFAAALLLACPAARGQQALPKTSDVTMDVAADGSMDLGFQMAFDAAPWRQWKVMVGDEPSRLRAMMRHRFAALTLENFKLERDDMNRVAKLSMHSPVGPQLRDDGSYQVPVDGYFRLVNGAGRTWYFSGNNPSAGNTLNNVKVTLPVNAAGAFVANANNADQALVFTLTTPAPASRWYYVGGAVLALAGALALAAGMLNRRPRVEILPPALPAARSMPVRAVNPPAPPMPTPETRMPPPMPGPPRRDPPPPVTRTYDEPD